MAASQQLISEALKNQQFAEGAWLGLYEEPFKVVHQHDAERLHHMGLGHLPLASIAFTPTVYTATLGKQALLMPQTEATLQTTMAAYPWFPVVPEGSVLEETAVLSEPRQALNLHQRLCQFFPTKFVVALVELQSLLKQLNVKAYLIGGLPRDLVLTGERQQELADIDITIEGNAITVAEQLAELSKNFTVQATFPEFGTAKLAYKYQVLLDVASTRTEVYHHCGALPTVTQRGVPLQLDVRRRDFTMNTLALSLNPLGMVVDYTHGLSDLELGQVQLLNGASLFEDPSRMLRAYKFATRLDFALGTETQQLMYAFCQVVEQTGYKGGGARIRTALQEWLSVPETALKHFYVCNWLQSGGLLLLASSEELGGAEACAERLLSLLEQGWKQLPQCLEWLEPLLAKDPLVIEQRRWQVYCCWLLACLPSCQARDYLASRLELHKEERECITGFLALWQHPALHTLPEHAPPMVVYELFHKKHPAACIAALLQLPEPEVAVQAYLRFCREYQHQTPALDGKDLQCLGVPEGPAVGALQKTLLKERLEGNLKSREDEIRFVEEQWLETENI